MGSVLLPCPHAIKSSVEVLGAKTTYTRPSKTKIRRGPGCIKLPGIGVHDQKNEIIIISTRNENTEEILQTAV